MASFFPIVSEILPLGKVPTGLFPRPVPKSCTKIARAPRHRPFFIFTPKDPTHLPAQPTRPAGHASQSSAGRSRRKRIKSCFDRLRRPKHTSHPESAGSAGAVRGASSNFGSPAQRVPTFPPPYSPSSTTVRPQGRPWPSQSRRQQVVVNFIADVLYQYMDPRIRIR